MRPQQRAVAGPEPTPDITDSARALRGGAADLREQAGRRSSRSRCSARGVPWRAFFEAACDRNASVHDAPAVPATANGYVRSMVIVVRAALQAMHRSTSESSNLPAGGVQAQGRDRASASRCPSRTSAQKRARAVDARRSSAPLRSLDRKSHQACRSRFHMVAPSPGATDRDEERLIPIAASRSALSSDWSGSHLPDGLVPRSP